MASYCVSMVTAAVLALVLVRAGLGLGSPSPGCGTELDLAPGLSHRVSVTLADPLQGGHSVLLSMCRGVSSDEAVSISVPSVVHVVPKLHLM